MSIESVMPSNHLILCHPLLLLPSIFPSIRVFSNELAHCSQIIHSMCPTYSSFSFSTSPYSEYSGLISFINWFEFLAVQGTLLRVFSIPTGRKHQFFSAQPSLWTNSHSLLTPWILLLPKYRNLLWFMNFYVGPAPKHTRGTWEMQRLIPVYYLTVKQKLDINSWSCISFSVLSLSLQLWWILYQNKKVLIITSF